MADALHTSGAVVQAVEARLDDAGLLTPLGPGAMDVRTGVMAGPGSTTIVTGTAATGQMTVQVNPHHWVTTRGSASGPYRGAREAVTTVNIAAAPASGSRIDVVYVKQQTTESGVPSPDATTGELYGVLQGTSGTTPAKPDLSTIVGAEELATVQIAAGTTSTNGAGATITNTARQTVARGGLLPVTSSTRPANPYPGMPIYETDTKASGFWDAAASTWRMFDTVLQTYTPVLAGPATVGVGTGGSISGEYMRAGKRCFVRIFVQFGTALNITAGAITVTLPIVPASGVTGGQRIAGHYFYPPIGVTAAHLYSASTASTPANIVVPADAASNAMNNLNMGSAAGAGTPAVAGNFGVANNANLLFQGEYEVA